MRQAVLGTATTRADREDYRPASRAGIARDAHASSSVACADFPGRQAVFLTAADQDAAEGIREELAVAASGPGARNGVSQFLRTHCDVRDSRARGDASHEYATTGLPRGQASCPRTRVCTIAVSRSYTCASTDRPGLHSMVATAPAGVVSLANRVSLQPAHQRL